MELLGTYTITRIDEKNYTLIYEIPDNCDFSASDKDGVYAITIELKPGETEPSLKYITETLNCEAFAGIIDVKFIQQDYENLGATYSTRPKVKILINE
ncbi:hypothetical protein [Flavobacterium sp.]|jgi:hypothetical protein|uniref:hypothetical protein n=1 Tax=Flavobacterium sp. TaxID=239 RepID=UPI0037BE6E6D